MIRVSQSIMAAAIAMSVAAIVSGAAGAQESAQQSAPRENLMKVCGDKWKAVREAESAKGVTWPQYLAQCRAAAAETKDRSVTAAEAKPAERRRSARSSPAADERKTARAGSAAIFPDLVSPRYATERPALARQRTCADQFKANKASDANGGLRWIEKGGGYWSRCNARLKEARA